MCNEISLVERKDQATGSRDYHVSCICGQSTRRPHGEDEDREAREEVLTTGTTRQGNNDGDQRQPWRGDDERRRATEMNGSTTRGWLRRSSGLA
uniref:Uncharacterized protein n=1 Tax=Oryza sativa subsp. japonica TaxID=39947 RepID=Q7XIK8_ORYSJ|nr:hypothetical protein [Oryza sativa Japonica Group]BAD31125.1 hypothetical protein [Oryza sativa Japonica Group]